MRGVLTFTLMVQQDCLGRTAMLGDHSEPFDFNLRNRHAISRTDQLTTVFFNSCPYYCVGFCFSVCIQTEANWQVVCLLLDLIENAVSDS